MSIKVNKKSRVLYMRGTMPWPDSDYYITTGIKETEPKAFERAVAYELAYKAKLELEHAVAEGGSQSGIDVAPTLLVLEKYFWDSVDKKESIARGTKRSYGSYWAAIREHFENISDCSHRSQLEAYVQKRRQVPIRETTIRREIRVLRKGWTEALEHGVKLPNCPSKPDNYIKKDTPDESKEGKYRDPRLILAIAKRCSTQEAKDRLIIAALTGIRMEELNRLDGAKVYPKVNPYPGLARVVFLPKEITKSFKNRWVGLTPYMWKLWDRSVPFDHISNERQYERASEELGLKYHVTLRDMRASFSTGARDFGARKSSVDSVMGHKRDMSDKYQKLNKERLADTALGAERWLKSGLKRPKNAARKKPKP